MNQKQIARIIENALEEDIAWGDITTQSTIPAQKQIKGRLIVKEDGFICGIEIFRKTMEMVDPRTQVQIFIQDGQHVQKGEVIAELTGYAAGILQAERVSLNFLQHMSGIATKTAALVAQLKGTKAQIADTRKTIPGLRILEKYAVRVGGGSNHRFNLADGVLIKDNHIQAAGGIKEAVEAARKVIPHTVKIEVEVENMEMINQALEARADIIMMDNMTIDEMRDAVSYIDGRALTEASGNMGDKDLRKVAMTGVDIISIGALTHTVRAMDISLRF